jgi:glycosyltransferase involved in cell wall biosynthesis
MADTNRGTSRPRSVPAFRLTLGADDRAHRAHGSNQALPRLVLCAGLNVCTIIAKNYVANARVLARSLAATNPGSRLWTLVIDDFSRHIDPAREPFEVLTPEQVGCEPFVHMALRYSVLELSTAVKPWLLRHLMGLTGGPITYLDPDIKIFGSLTALDDLAREHGVVLTPHNSSPIPQDGRRPSQVDVMIAGIYNLGYVSLAPRPEVDRLLDWWADRLRRDCRVDPVWGYFVDQRWFDLAPGFLDDIAIVRAPQYNLAYWNLHERRLEKADGGYRVDGQPLAFFHFSGFDPEEPLILSRHQNRIDVTEQPVLEEILRGYANDVLAEGYAEARHWPYDYGSLADGTRLDDRLREAFDDYATAHDDRVPSPFTLDGVRAFDAWLASPADGAPAGISRAAAQVYESRPDIRGAFPEIAGADREPFLQWVAGPGAAEEPLLARRAPGTTRADGEPAPGSVDASAGGSAAGPGWAQLRGAPWGVNVIGDFHAEGASGEIARAVVSALDAGGQRVVPVLSHVTTPDAHDRPFGAVEADQAPFAINLVCIEPGILPEFVQASGSASFAGRYSIGLWSWPVEAFPDSLRSRFSLVEEVWAPSQFTATALRPLADVPVHVMPFPVSPPPLEVRTRAELGLPDGFLFLARVDFREDAERQNPVDVVRAFRTAFDPGTEVALVIDCAHTERAEAAFAELRSASEGDERIRLVKDQRGGTEALSAISLCDCFVSLHRAEAFGLDLAAAMWLGRPTVATGYSGNAEYMTAENSFLVDHRLVAIGAGHDPYPPDAEWAQPDVRQAAAQMRMVFTDPAAATRRGAKAAQGLRSTHGAELTGEFVVRRLGAIRATGHARRPADAVADRPPALARLPKRILDGPPAAVGGRGGGARAQLRETILRLIKPFTEHQKAVDGEIVVALSELSRQITDARLGTQVERAQRLATVRQFEAIPAQIDALEGRLGGIEEIKRILTEQTDRGVYLALSELHRRHTQIGPEPGPPGADRSLTGFELRAFSQNGEDGVLAEILRRTGAPSRHFVEFGVESGREGNCVFLADVRGWQGLFMESEDEMFRRLEAKYAAEGTVETIRARVNAENIESLFAQASVPAESDVVSIDIDGQDYWIWAALEGYRPRVLIIEYNSSLDPRRCLVQPDEPGHGWDGTAFYGASLGALERLGRSKGYRLVHTDLSAVNAFFVRADLAGDAFPHAHEVARRGTPNYYQRGIEHPGAIPGARYLDLETGELVRASGREHPWPDRHSP